MAFLPLRALSRSQQIRIGQQVLHPDSTTYIDLSDQSIRSDLAHHTAFGAIYQVGPLQGSDKPQTIWTGATVTEGTSSADRSVRVLTGELRKNDGAYVVIAQQDLTITNADATLDRIDDVVVNAAGTASIVVGTAAATPVEPTLTSAQTRLAKVAVVAAGGTNEAQTVTLTAATSGTFTLTFDDTGSNPQTTATIAFNAAATTGAASVRAKLEALSNIGTGNVTVSGSAGGPYLVTFVGTLQELNVNQMTASGAGLNAAVNEVQQVAVDAAGGDFTLTYSGQTTAAINFNASNTTGAASVRQRLEDLSNIAPGDVAVTGGPGNAGASTPYIVTFQGALAATNVAQMTSNSAGLTGGASTATVSTTTAGAPAGTVAVTTGTPGVQVGIANADITDARERAAA